MAPQSHQSHACACTLQVLQNLGKDKFSPQSFEQVGTRIAKVLEKVSSHGFNFLFGSCTTHTPSPPPTPVSTWTPKPPRVQGVGRC